MKAIKRRIKKPIAALKLLSRDEYDKVFVPSLPREVCPFCEWQKYQIVLKEFKSWVWIANLAPYWNWHTILISRRHFIELSETTKEESSEFFHALSYAKERMLKANLKRADGEKVKKIVYFWRYRLDRFDPISGNIRPDHFHVHITPDKDHLWDPILDKEPHKCDVIGKLGEIS